MRTVGLVERRLLHGEDAIDGAVWVVPKPLRLPRPYFFVRLGLHEHQRLQRVQAGGVERARVVWPFVVEEGQEGVVLEVGLRGVVWCGVGGGRSVSEADEIGPAMEMMDEGGERTCMWRGSR